MNFSHIVAYSIPREKKIQPDKDDPLFTPSPTKYDPKKNAEHRSPSWRIGTAKRQGAEKKDKFPGSGTYEHKVFIGVEGPKYSMKGKYDLDGLNKENRCPKVPVEGPSPGPGYYEYKDSKGGPLYTIRTRLSGKKRKKVRSAEVGDYELRNDNLLFGNAGNKFTNQKRENESLNKNAMDTPGPGNYNYNQNAISTKTPMYGFSRAERFDYNKKSKKERPVTPGPGSYSHKVYFGVDGVPHYTFYKEKKFYKSKYEENKNPAPNQYFSAIKYNPNTSIYSIPKSERKDFSVNKWVLSFPGPERYDPKFEHLSRVQKFPVWGIGKSNREQCNPVERKIKDKDNMIGPGTYDSHTDKFPGGPQYTIRMKTSKSHKDYCPSPTRYNINMLNRPKEPSYSIGKEERGDDLKQVKKDNFPGVGQYSIKDSEGTARKYTIPQDLKFKKSENFVPGPGMYKIPCRFNDISDLTRSQGLWNPQYKYV